jgi:hypothetical protein
VSFRREEVRPHKAHTGLQIPPPQPWRQPCTCHQSFRPCCELANLLSGSVSAIRAPTMDAPTGMERFFRTSPEVMSRPRDGEHAQRRDGCWQEQLQVQCPILLENHLRCPRRPLFPKLLDGFGSLAPCLSTRKSKLVDLSWPSELWSVGDPPNDNRPVCVPPRF